MKIAILMPTLETLPVDTVGSLIGILKREQTTIYFASSSLVYDSRNQLMNIAYREKPDYVLWIDSDMVFPSDALDRLIQADKDFITGLYFGRKNTHEPIIYRTVKPRTFRHNAINEVEDCISEELFTVQGCGFGFVLMKNKVIEDMINAYRSPFEPYKNLGEDLSFCYRWLKLSKHNQIWCDSTIPIQHVGTQKFGRQDWQQKTENGIITNDNVKTKSRWVRWKQKLRGMM